jgi:type I restriction enzyme, S subunit
MNIKAKNNIPKLRFLEFSGDWHGKRIGDVLKVGSGRDYKHLSAGNIPVYGTGGYMKSVDEYLYDGESVCIGRKGTIDKPVYLNEKFWTVDTLFYTHSFKDSVPKFIYAIFQSINWKQHNEASGVPSLSKATIEKIKIEIPQPKEQQKIASFLSSVDERLSQLGEKKKLLEQYKKGMMQKLFTQQISFKDENNNNYPDWEEKKLGTIAKITTGKLDANAMVDGGKYRFYTCAREYYKIDEYAFDTDALLVSGNGANVGYIHHYKGKFNAYQRTYVLDGFIEKIKYIKFYLDCFLKKRIGVEKKDGNTPYIVMSTLSNMMIKLPHTDEQNKIANFLTSIDNKINLIESELNQVKTFKKGLLQQMFI